MHAARGQRRLRLWPGRVDHSSTIWARGLTICAPRAKALIDVGVP